MGSPNSPSKWTAKSLILKLDKDWIVSTSLHLVLIGGIWILFALNQVRSKFLDVDVIYYPEAAAPTLSPTIEKPKEEPEAAPVRKVFGASRKSITDDQDGLAVKAGNTVVTAPDDKVLNADDADSLPIPTDEYLVSSMPTLQSEVRIDYPAEAKAKNVEGPVVMDILIDENGVVRQAIVLSGPGSGLNEAALKAIRSFKFKPANASGKPVAVRIRYTYRFVLER